MSTKKIFTELSKTEFNMKEFFLPFERLDLSYGWKSIINAKRAHYFDTAGDKTIVVSGKGDFIFFETKNFFSEKHADNRKNFYTLSKFVLVFSVAFCIFLSFFTNVLYYWLTPAIVSLIPF